MTAASCTSGSATPSCSSSCKPGEAIVYPSDTLHQVVPVTKGERLVAITFIQSRIQDPFRRNMLFELNEVAALEGCKMKPENFARLQLVQRSCCATGATRRL